MKTKIEYLVQSRTRNKKTGDIPTIIIGKNADQVLKSCIASGCKLLQDKLGGSGEYKKLGLKPCYAHNSTVSWGTKSIFRSLIKGTKEIADYSVKEGFRLSARHAKYYRLSSIGDASALSKDQIKEIKKEGKKYGLKPLGYTANKSASHLKSMLLLSCPTMEEADAAVADGWRSTTIFSEYKGKKTFVTPAGNKGIICPEQVQSIQAHKKSKDVTPREKITCNICGLCSKGNTHKTKYKVIGFVSH